MLGIVRVTRESAQRADRCALRSSAAHNDRAAQMRRATSRVVMMKVIGISCAAASAMLMQTSAQCRNVRRLRQRRTSALRCNDREQKLLRCFTQPQPIAVERAIAIGALIRVRAEVISLRLQQVGR